MAGEGRAEDTNSCVATQQPALVRTPQEREARENTHSRGVARHSEHGIDTPCHDMVACICACH